MVSQFFYFIYLFFPPFLCRIFTLSPPAQKMFKKMQDVPFSELENDEVFRSHSLQVMETISLAVSMLRDNDPEELVGVLQDLGMSHKSQGLQTAHFDVSIYTGMADSSSALGNGMWWSDWQPSQLIVKGTRIFIGSMWWQFFFS